MRLPRSLQPRQAFVLIVLAGSTCLLAWAALARVDVIVRTDGRIVPAGKAQIVQHLEGGIVRNILVHEGEVVKAGQILLELSDIQARSTVQQERSRSAMLRGREARLLAESTGAGSLVFPKDLVDEEVRRAETAAYQSRRARVGEEVAALRGQTAQKRGEIAETEGRRRNLLAEVEVAQQQLRVLEGLKRNGAASNMEVLDSQSRLQRLLSQITEAEATLPRLRAAVAESESRVGEVQAKFRAEASGELTQIRGDLEKSGFELNTTTDRLERNRVRAPVSGFVNRLQVATIGGVVRPGEALMEITSDDSGVLIEAKARPNDRAGLHSGLPARVRIGAYDYATYGALDGSVTEVSADTLTDEREGRYYRVMVKIASKGHSPLAAVPGMTAEADIVVGKRTVLSYVFSPLMRFRDGAFRDPV
ncbi:HlyD family type I secretion periplasmic adaptor subunit [Rhodoferax lacus]|uniref:Membrane fusion protein (MFP) family protein n=1 Tax=Rhodoferax lacus TaxID=2184758 RepID=A0A3E1RDS4_9BURK|nr:HlyD family type I secretion periplasmic adaptor subunit [Rhodoferax lacus]RFO97518.1 HlyD family type I secretion periplasmic adaptor subunit [Rhodoferax lacus]